MTITGLMEAGLRVRCSFIQTAPCADYLGVDGNKARVPVEEVSSFSFLKDNFFENLLFLVHPTTSFINTEDFLNFVDYLFLNYS